MTQMNMIMEYTAVQALSRKMTEAEIVTATVERFLESPADIILVCLVSIACEFQEKFIGGNGENHRLGGELYKHAALLACDIVAVRSLGILSPRGIDIIHYWESSQGPGQTPE